MLKFKEITLKAHYPGFGKGARPGYSCTVEMQHGEHSFDSVAITLDPEAVREVIAFAIGKALEKLTFDPATLNVEGHAGEERLAEPVSPPDMLVEPMVIEADPLTPETEQQEAL